MPEVKPRVRVPEIAKKGEVIEIKTLISHPMESGARTDASGARIPRDIINRFVCTYNGEVVFEADWNPAISANPYLAFTTVATESGDLVFTWVDDHNEVFATTAHITVE